jgi:hypothetical protein
VPVHALFEGPIALFSRRKLLCDRSSRWKKRNVPCRTGRPDIAFFGAFSTPATDATILNDKRHYLEEQTPSS